MHYKECQNTISPNHCQLVGNNRQHVVPFFSNHWPFSNHRLMTQKANVYPLTPLSVSFSPSLYYIPIRLATRLAMIAGCIPWSWCQHFIPAPCWITQQISKMVHFVTLAIKRVVCFWQDESLDDRKMNFYLPLTIVRCITVLYKQKQELFLALCLSFHSNHLM